MNFLFVCCHVIMHTRRHVLLPSFGEGHAMAVAVCRRPYTTEVRGKSQDSPRGICGRPSETWTAVPPFPPVITRSTVSTIPPELHIYSHSFAIDACGGAIG